MPMTTFTYIGEKFAYFCRADGKSIEKKCDDCIMPYHIDRQSKIDVYLDNIILIFEVGLHSDLKQVWRRYFTTFIGGNQKLRELHVVDVILAGNHSISDKPQMHLFYSGQGIYLLQKTLGSFTAYKERRIGSGRVAVSVANVVRSICDSMNRYSMSFYKDQSFIVFSVDKLEDQVLRNVENGLGIPVVCMLAGKEEVISAIIKIISDKMIVSTILRI